MPDLYTARRCKQCGVDYCGWKTSCSPCLNKALMAKPFSHERSVWKSMRGRCQNPNVTGYQYYGGRGITVCERWNSFANFLADMGPRPSSGHSIERKDNDGSYSPENCCWATRLEQACNVQKSRRITHDGRTQTISQWARELNMEYNTLFGRISNYGWAHERALTTPVRRYL